MTLTDMKINNSYTYITAIEPSGSEGDTWLNIDTGLSFVFISSVWEPSELDIDSKFDYLNEGFFKGFLDFLGCVETIYMGCFEVETDVITIADDTTHKADIDDYLSIGGSIYQVIATTDTTIQVDKSIVAVFNFNYLVRYKVDDNVCRVAGLLLWFDLYKRDNVEFDSEKIGNYSYNKSVNGKPYPDDITGQIDAIKCVTVA